MATGALKVTADKVTFRARDMTPGDVVAAVVWYESKDGSRKKKLLKNVQGGVIQDGTSSIDCFVGEDGNVLLEFSRNALVGAATPGKMNGALSTPHHFVDAKLDVG